MHGDTVVSITRNQKRKRDPQTQKRWFDSGNPSRLYSAKWFLNDSDINQYIHDNLVEMRALSRREWANNAMIKRHAMLLKQNVVGHKGIELIPEGRNRQGQLDVEGNRALRAHWNRFMMRGNCDVTGRLSGVDLQNLFLIHAQVDGEAMTNTVRGFDNEFGYAIQFVDPDLLDEKWNGRQPDGLISHMGVILDQWRRPVRYHFRGQHPGPFFADVDVPDPQDFELPATDVIHGFKNNRGNQSRGIPEMHAAILRAQMLDEFLESMLNKARNGANTTMVLKTDDDWDDAQAKVHQLQESHQGEIPVLNHDDAIENLESMYPAQEMPEMVKILQRSISTALGPSYAALTNNRQDTTFASHKVESLQEQDYYRTEQKFLVEQFLQPLYLDWLEDQLMKGAITASGRRLGLESLGKFSEHRWQPREWQTAEPVKETNSDLLEWSVGLKTFEDLLAKRGKDYESHMRRYKFELDDFEERDLEVIRSTMVQVLQDMDQSAQATPNFQGDTGDEPEDS